MNTIEQRAAALLDTATTGLDPRVDHLVAGGVARGRARRRRRRMGTTFAAVAAIGVIGAAANVVELPKRAADANVYMSPTAPTSLPAEAQRRFSMDPAKVAWVLSDLLPSGDVSHRVSGSDQVDSERYRDGRLRFNGGLVAVRGEWVGDADDAICADRGCVDVGNGDRMLITARSPMSKDGSRVSNSVILYLSDGWSIGVNSANYPETPADDPIAPRPVLTVEELKAIVTSDVWLDEQQ